MKHLLIILSLMASINSFAQFEHQRIYSTFDNLSLSGSDTFNNGSDRSGGLMHMDRFFVNNYDTMWGSWSGWALSNMTDDTTPGYQNQYSAITGTGVSFTPNYLVGYNNTYISFDEPVELSGAYFTNSTYAYLDMLNGSGFSKKFGGDDGNDPDFFKLTVFSYLNGVLQDSAGLFLADFRSSDNAEDYILDDWMFLDFNEDEENDITVDSLVFVISSSDVGQWGINTPQYFCMDDLNAFNKETYHANGNNNMNLDTFYNGSDLAGGFAVDYFFFQNTYNSMWQSWEGWSASTMYDDTTPGYTNQYSAMAQISSPTKTRTSVNYHMVSYGVENSIRAPYQSENQPYIYKLAPPAPWPLTLGITNSAYAYHDMLNGSNFSKKFGGVNGTDPDYFRVLMKYVNVNDSVVATDTVYLADFRFEDSQDDYILDDWTFIQLSDRELWQHNVERIDFQLESSDNGAWGMNTPAYFCLTTNYEFGSVSKALEDKPSINVYPNPTTDHISLSSDARIEKVKIYSMQAELMMESDDTRLDVSSLTPGLYFAEITTAKGVAVSKFVKQ